MCVLITVFQHFIVLRHVDVSRAALREPVPASEPVATVSDPRILAEDETVDEQVYGPHTSLDESNCNVEGSRKNTIR